MMSETLDFFPQFFNYECFTSTLDFPPKNGPSTPSPTVFFLAPKMQTTEAILGDCAVFPCIFCVSIQLVVGEDSSISGIAISNGLAEVFVLGVVHVELLLLLLAQAGWVPGGAWCHGGASCGISWENSTFLAFFLGVWSDMKVKS